MIGSESRVTSPEAYLARILDSLTPLESGVISKSYLYSAVIAKQTCILYSCRCFNRVQKCCVWRS